MNVYVDDYIAFDYPEDYLLNVCQVGQSYSLARGGKHVFISFEDDFSWKMLQFQFRQSFDVIHASGRKSPLSPRETCSIEDYDTHGFIGEGFWYHRISAQDDVIRTHLRLFVERNGNRLYLDVRDRSGFEEDFVDWFLSKIFFPGEDGYIGRLHQGSKSHTAQSPYMVKLPYFGENGKKRTAGCRFNVEYEGDDIVQAQSNALQTLLQNEERMYKAVSESVFSYYTEHIYPLLTSQGFVTEDLKEILPAVSCASEIMDYVELGCILIHEPRDNGISPLGLRFECIWDVEHGLGVRLHGGQVEAVGMDEIAIIRDLFQQP